LKELVAEKFFTSHYLLCIAFAPCVAQTYGRSWRIPVGDPNASRITPALLPSGRCRKKRGPNRGHTEMARTEVRDGPLTRFKNQRIRDRETRQHFLTYPLRFC
jgi:hypothetical protein